MESSASYARPEFFASRNIYAVILCGGSGTRLWPLSRSSMPKQFLALGDASLSFLQQSVERLHNIVPSPSKRWLVLAKAHESLARSQLGLQIGRILPEPEGRNTAAAVAWAAWELYKIDPTALMVVLSADHVITNIVGFEESLARALLLAESGYFVTLGIRPTYPATGFGYIELGIPLDERAQAVAAHDPHANRYIGWQVRSFKEKPNQQTAEAFVRSGHYLWNAGIFIWQVEAFWQKFSELAPEIATPLASLTPDTLVETYARIPKQPIDIAFMEKTSPVACVPALFEWRDIGSWLAVWESLQTNALHEASLQGTVTVGDVYVRNTTNSLIYAAPKAPFVAAIGVENLVVVATSDAVLVIPRERSQDVKHVVEFLEAKQRKNLL